MVILEHFLALLSIQTFYSVSYTVTIHMETCGSSWNCNVMIINCVRDKGSICIIILWRSKAVRARECIYYLPCLYDSYAYACTRIYLTSVLSWSIPSTHPVHTHTCTHTSSPFIHLQAISSIILGPIAGNILVYGHKHCCTSGCTNAHRTHK